MYFLTVMALSGMNLRHLVTTEAEHCLCCNRATVLSVCGGICLGDVTDTEGEFLLLPYIFGFPYVDTHMTSGLHSA